MASWLKVAEDLLEVVDRRAKSVARDVLEEQIDPKLQASNGSELRAKRTKSKEKAQQILSSSIESPQRSDNAPEQTSIRASGDNVLPDTDKVVVSSENAGAMSNDNTAITSNELQLDLSQDGNMSGAPLPDNIQNDVARTDGACNLETPATANDLGVVSSSIDSDITLENTLNGNDLPSDSVLMVSGVETVDREHPADAGQSVKSGDVDAPSRINHDGSEVESMEKYNNSDTQGKDSDLQDEPPSRPKKKLEPKTDTLSMGVQEQLEEAQGLLKSATSSGQSKEGRLARVCAGLSSRLQEYKSENAQLEELLTAERERTNSYELRIKQLQKDLSMSKIEVSRVESNMAAALAAKNSEIEALVSSMDAVKRQATTSEGKLASLQANMESMMRNRDLTETRMMQALREELTSAERRAEEEHAAHNATKMAAMQREVELEHRAVETSTALARMQRTVDERTSKVAELEQKLALLEAESASLNQELQDMEARARRGQKRTTEEANQALQVHAWQEEVERARQGQRDAESKLSSLEVDVQKMRVEMAGMKRDAEHYSRQEHMELEKRYRELTDLLYHKQTQLEAMASEKAAAEFQLEKEVKRLKEAQVEVEKSKAPRRSASTYWEEDTDLKTLEALPLHHRHVVGASLQFQKAVKLIDSGAVRATRFLWRYPVARVTLLFYLVFVHLFLMYLLHRLQAQADSFAAGEVAASMGLANSNLP